MMHLSDGLSDRQPKDLQVMIHFNVLGALGADISCRLLR